LENLINTFDDHLKNLKIRSRMGLKLSLQSFSLSRSCKNTACENPDEAYKNIDKLINTIIFSAY
jgi:hypothetical protein